VITPIQKENHPSHQFLFWWNGLPERLLEAIKGQKNKKTIDTTNTLHFLDGDISAFAGATPVSRCHCFVCDWFLQNNDTTNPNPAVWGSLTMIIYYI